MPATTLVDAAIDHFSQSLFEQPTKIQESAVSQIAACIGDTALAKNAGRRAAVVSNIVIALSKAISTLTTRTINDVRQNERVVSPLQEVLQVIMHKNQSLREGVPRRSRPLREIHCRGLHWTFLRWFARFIRFEADKIVNRSCHLKSRSQCPSRICICIGFDNVLCWRDEGGIILEIGTGIITLIS